MLVLRTVLFGPLHGYGIAKAIAQTSEQSLQIEFGSLYPALRRLELKGWISSKWEISETKRRAKMYRLTAAGRKQLIREESRWTNLVAAITRVMTTAPKGEGA
jgi:transcriptional regulator